MDDASLSERLSMMLQPWEAALADPAAAQNMVLQTYLAAYAQTRDGAQHHCPPGSTVDTFRERFPVRTYDDMKPLIQQVMEGDENVLLHEPVIGWAITRGTTGDEPKFIPMTAGDLKLRVSAARAVMQFIKQQERYDILQGVNLNLNFPSTVGTLQAGEREIEYGYSSGIYTRYVAEKTPIRSIPTQAQIDAIGGGTTRKDWDARFHLASEACKDRNVTLVGGVAPTALRFGQYLKREEHCYPKDRWNVILMTLGSVPGINTRHQPALRAMYGNVYIREIYGTTEGMFGQQYDEKRAWVPNYDLFFFEVRTRRGIIMLHEMQPGEIGSLIVSTPILPRYDIGDRILCVSPPYYRCIGRQQWWTTLNYFWNELRSLNLGRL